MKDGFLKEDAHMDLLKTVLIYMTMVFATSVQNAPEPDLAALEEPTPTPYVTQAQTETPPPTPKPTPVPTIDITPNPAYKTIQVGDSGDRVRELQAKLAEYGYYTGDVDGRFGNQTRRAVEAFQYQHGLGVDGIAGRRTLTVLYESDQVRPAPTSTPAAFGGATVIPGAITPAPENVELTAVNTFAPVETAAPADTPAATDTPTSVPTDTPEPAETPAPTQEPQFTAMEGYSIVAGGKTLMVKPDEGEEAPIAPYLLGDRLYLPLNDVLNGIGATVISSSDLDKEELAFALGNQVVRISYTEDQAGQPIHLQAFINGQEQVLPGRDIRMTEEGRIYVPAQCLESLLGMTAVTDDAAKTVTVAVPADTPVS